MANELSFHERLFAVQMELNAPKGQYNDFGKYNYRSCEDILEAVKPLLKKYALMLILKDDIQEANGKVYVKATATIIDLKDTANKIENTAFAREDEAKKGMDGAQITGASSSYARKYALNGLLCIDDNKDADKTNVGDNDEPVEDACTQAQIAEILRLNCNIVNIKKTFHIDKLEELTYAQAEQVLTKKRQSIGG